MTDVVVATEEHTIVIKEGTEESRVVVQEDTTYTIISPAEQGPPGTVSLDNIASQLVSADSGNNLTIGTDGKLFSLPQLSSTNW
jgi:hypothetical protein